MVISSRSGRARRDPNISVKQVDDALKRFINAVGKKLLEERKRLGLSQIEVAEQIGIEPESVSRIENGVISPTLARLRQFAQIYGCSLEFLIGNASDQTQDLTSRLGLELKDLPELDRVFVTEKAIEIARHIKACRKRKN